MIRREPTFRRATYASRRLMILRRARFPYGHGRLAIQPGVSRARRTGRPASWVFDVRLAGLGSGTVGCRDGVSLQPSITAADVTAPDVVVVPGLDDDLAASFDQNRRWVPWLARWHAA